MNESAILPEQPVVTVYIPTRNRAQLLTRALSSVWRQVAPARIEIVVVDDASDDETPLLLHEWSESGLLRWLRNDRPLGSSASRNVALREAQGRYATGLDDDDEMMPGRIAALLGALRPGDAFVCASDLILTPGRSARMRLVPARIGPAAILSRNVAGNQVLAERAKLLACGGFDESLPAAQDYDLWIRMILAHGAARGLRRPLQRIHVPGGTELARISTSPARRRGYWLVYRKHRHLMDERCRRAHLYNLRRASGHATRLPHDFRFFVRGNRLRLLWHTLCDLRSGTTAR